MAAWALATIWVDEGVVDRLGVADDGHRGVVQNGVSLGDEEELGSAAVEGEAVRRAADLAGRRGVSIFQRIGPDDDRQAGAFLVIGREIKRARELDPVVPLVLDAAAFLTPVIWGAGSLKAVRGRIFLDFRAYEMIIRDLGLGFLADDDRIPAVAGEAEEGLVLAVDALEEARLSRRS